MYIVQWKWQGEILQGWVIFHHGWHWGFPHPWRREVKGWLSTWNMPACGPFNKCLVHLSGIRTDIWSANPIWPASPRLLSLAAGRHFVWCVRNQCKLPALALATAWLITNVTSPLALIFQYRQSNLQQSSKMLWGSADDPAIPLILSADFLDLDKGMCGVCKSSHSDLWSMLCCPLSSKKFRRRSHRRTFQHFAAGEGKVTQSCLTLRDPMDCRMPGSSVHGILQARIVEWVAIPFSRDLPQPGIKPRSLELQVILYCLSHQESP